MLCGSDVKRRDTESPIGSHGGESGGLSEDFAGGKLVGICLSMLSLPFKTLCGYLHNNAVAVEVHGGLGDLGGSSGGRHVDGFWVIY